MTDRFEAVGAYQAALTFPDESAAEALRHVLADDVVVQTNFGRADGIGAAIALLREPRVGGLLAGGAAWSVPAAEGDRVVVTARLPETAPFSGVELAFQFAGDKISRAEHQTLPPAPVRPGPLRLTQDIKDAVNGALDNKTPMMIAYRDDGDQIHLSYRGTIQAYSDDQLALWAREPEGGLPRNIAARPQVTLFYHDPASRTSYSFYGRARLEQDAGTAAAIFENSNPREQQMDFRRRGVAIVVDLDKVEGRGPTGRVLMVRA
jgi:Pyridoxamine 5'-phosphate oxidase